MKDGDFMRMYDIILKKRNGLELSKEEIDFFIKGVCDETIPDYQASALLMAIYFQGMTDEETKLLTLAMAQSGDTVDLSELCRTCVDKHSTGGVGDKTTLIVAPMVSSLGVTVAKMSGRGLGHTGGTVDKLQSIEGFKTELSRDEFLKTAKLTGMCIAGQSGNLAPADKKLYALRDVTATVDSIPLIASSIMSKKLAAGSHKILLDVKTGSGAFMNSLEQSRLLAKKMVAIGNGAGRETAALITNMDEPLGNSVGNFLEIKEAVSVLKGGGADDLVKVCVALAANMLSLATGDSVEVCEKRAAQTLKNGKAFEKFKEAVKAQGGNTQMLDCPERFLNAKHAVRIISDKTAYIARMDAKKIGTAAMILGAGREKKTDKINTAAGITINAKTGDRVLKGSPLATLYTNDISKIDEAKRLYISALTFSDSPCEKPVLIYDLIKGE